MKKHFRSIEHENIVFLMSYETDNNGCCTVSASAMLDRFIADKSEILSFLSNSDMDIKSPNVLAIDDYKFIVSGKTKIVFQNKIFDKEKVEQTIAQAQDEFVRLYKVLNQF